MSINIFNITWVNISDNLIAWYLRDLENFVPGIEKRYWLRDYIRAINQPIEDLTNRLFENAFNNQKKYFRTGQHQVLEITLNDEFDSALRRIYITDAFGLSNYNYSLYLLQVCVVCICLYISQVSLSIL